MSEYNKFNITFSNFNKLVFGVRITDEFGNNFQNEESLFKYENRWIPTERKNNTITQIYNDINISKEYNWIAK